MTEWIDVCPEADLAVDKHHVISAHGHPVAVFNRAGTLLAVEDYCPHQGLPLSDGYIEGTEIECPFHGARFCLKSGDVLEPPACENLKTYDVRGMVQIGYTPK